MFKTGHVFIVAEMANAHEGKIDLAKAIVEAAAQSGADAIKAQIFTADELAVPSHPNYELYQKLQMTLSQWEEFVELARGKGLKVFTDVFGTDSLETAKAAGFDGFKIHAADVGNPDLLRKVAATGLPILLSTGGSTWIETAEALSILRENNDPTIVLMHGIQNYPTQPEDSLLRRIPTLKSRFQLPVGFAAHPAGESALARELPLWAVAAGADLVEIHLTMDRTPKGLDYYSSLEPAELKSVVQNLRQLEPTLGPSEFCLTDNEKTYRGGHKKQVVALRDIQKGETLTAENIGLKRVPPESAGIPLSFQEALGRKLVRDLPCHSTIQRKDLRMKVVATLACRLASTRLYGKPMQLIGGKPIIQHLIERLRQVKALDEICLAITEGADRHVFIDFAERNGIPYVVGNEKDVLGRLIMAADHVGGDIALRTTTENPYLYWENIDEMIRLHVENGADLTVTEKLPLGAFIETISVDALKKSHKHGEDRHRSELCTLFISENPNSFKIQRLSAPQKLQRPELRLTVDTPEDLMLVRALYNELKGDTHLITIEEIVDYLTGHPEVAALNSKFNTLYLWK